MVEIAPFELRDKLATGTPLSVVDIRERADYESWHIPGATNVPVYDALADDDDRPLIEAAERLSRDRPIVTVCRAGVISQHAARVLGSLGFEAASLSGGMRGWGAVWSEAPIPLAGLPEAVVLQVRRIGKGCLSYLVGARGEAVVIDPSVAAAAYLEPARRAGLRITRVIETHVHADHLSRAREVAEAAGAELLMPANRRVRFPFGAIADGWTLEIGGLPLRALATPGHTLESTCYELASELLFTGDTLFVGAVGRPDLERGDEGAERGARLLYRSLQERVLVRPAAVSIYAAHHGEPPRLDGRPIGAALGEARSRLALLGLGEDEFVRRVLASLGEKPGNFRTILAVNEGRADFPADALELEAGPNSCAAG
jgi:glyoxylase-like metal-dependent hydrolase (beta-lactamase superfamily II)/rhodanese-related sulfurtransferase